MRAVKDSLAAPLKEKRASLAGSFGGMKVVRRAQVVPKPGLLGDNLWSTCAEVACRSASLSASYVYIAAKRRAAKRRAAGAGSYTERYKTPREYYNPEANREEITWT